jgi:hypothetical protein
MSEPCKNRGISRRAVLGSAALAAAGRWASAEAAGPVAVPAAAARPRSTVRDRFWIFTVFAGGDNPSLERGHVHGGSRMTPAEGAFWLGVPNLLLIRSDDKPPLPSRQPGYARTSFQQYAASFQPLDRVVWSVVGSGGQGGMDELEPVIELAREFPNIAGVYLDDFIVDVRRRPDGRDAGRPAMPPSELKRARRRLESLGRPMDFWVTLYTHEINPRRKAGWLPFRGCDPPLADFLDLFDVLTLWTWNSRELVALEENLAALRAIAPRTARIALGLYLWDYHNAQPVPMELMRHQCELGLKWLRENRIQEMIFLANTVLDVGIPTAEFARRWIAQVGSQPLPST